MGLDLRPSCQSLCSRGLTTKIPRSGVSTRWHPQILKLNEYEFRYVLFIDIKRRGNFLRPNLTFLKFRRLSKSLLCLGLDWVLVFLWKIFKFIEGNYWLGNYSVLTVIVEKLLLPRNTFDVGRCVCDIFDH